MQHEYYNTDNFPIFVCHHGNWDIYCNANGYCASIAVNPECKSSHFGNANYLRVTLGINLTDSLESANR